MTQVRARDLLQTLDKTVTLEPERRRRLLACGLDELEREAAQLERVLIQTLNQVRAIQGKRAVIVPKG